MSTPLNFILIENRESVFDLEETSCMCSTFESEPNITLDTLKHLISGKPVLDISDEEYIHWIQLDQESLNYLKERLISND